MSSEEPPVADGGEMHDAGHHAEVKVESDEDPSGSAGDSVIEEVNEDDASAYEEAEANASKKLDDIEIPKIDEEDEEVRMAMEMALAAMKNPHLGPAELRKLVEANNKQSQFVKEVEEKKARLAEKKKEEEQKRWNEQKDSMFSWFTSSAAAIAQSAEEYQWSQTKAKYAEKIKHDKQIRETRKALKAKKKALKAIKLQGNRVETRHVFKRQRMEKHLIEVTSLVEKHRHTFCDTNYNATAYAKAMLKASKKWSKPSANDKELALEAQLCRNMHQMLALEKQKAKLKKSLKEIKKYLQRCKSWLSDKQALCELHMLTLDATQASMKNIYQDTLSRQDQLIAKIRKEHEEYSDIKELVASEPEATQLYDQIPTYAGPGATLNALRGMPFRDSIMLSKGELMDPDKAEEEGKEGKEPRVVIEGAPPHLAGNSKQAVDEGSITSALTDPDEVVPASSDSVISADSVSGNIAFGDDAPWLGDEEEMGDAGSEDKKKKSRSKSKSRSNGGAEKSFEKENIKNGHHHDSKKKSSKSNGTKKAPPSASAKKPPPVASAATNGKASSNPAS